MAYEEANRKKQEQLGMPIGTATHRLRKNILFSLLVKYEENTCFKCGKIIDNVDDLTIEHKIPWLHVSPELFWDLSNIAFSHQSCNKPDRPYRPSKDFNKHLRKAGPAGMSWCSKHREFLPISKFSADKQKWSQKKSYCKDCHKAFRLP